ncbi:hypothetical protein COT87_01910 [Candidatus Collierbacteria bacterium CG10_big_fil_rev_8_21_14_0_10_44_9]|uniref:Uncharacterized protein n=1 Tax=Candidatus Collierbacteria bacterium CG10_big_fil_rev_8_21_14_0_10_44_9 TaxID=1974535 RepID=A0A2H0VIP1_9BACT|nr:MAG: hypothetical protein COT87_01910 [Candidatus Collierbacteria bacterium CG10_big_fil_rev_8_21_14_0_10_44_9]
MARTKTREEKIQSGYRLKNFKLAASERTSARDVSEFGYLSSKYIVKDLMKTLLYTVVIVGLLVLAKFKLR